MTHKFKVGQLVRRARTPLVDDQFGFGAVSEVVRLMPADQTGEVSYRVRSGFAERMVRESEIVSASRQASSQDH